MKRREIESLGERLLARSTSKLSCDQPELCRDLKIAAGLVLLLARLPDVEVDILPGSHSVQMRSSSH